MVDPLDLVSHLILDPVDNRSLISLNPVDTMTSTGGNKSCATPSNITSIVATYDPPNNACGEIDVSITGGRAPYTVSIIAPYVNTLVLRTPQYRSLTPLLETGFRKLGKYSNLTSSTNPIKLANIISTGEAFYRKKIPYNVINPRVVSRASTNYTSHASIRD